MLSEASIPHAIIRCQECITGQHLLTKILLEVLGALGLLDSGDWERFGKGKCEHVSSLAVFLGDALNTPAFAAAASEKFVVVLDGIDTQREASHTLLAALARLGEVVSLYSCDYAFFGGGNIFFIAAHCDTNIYKRSELILPYHLC